MRPTCGTTSQGFPAVAARLGGAPASWSISEVGDGNLNLVFIVKGDAGGIAVKQALPYVRLVGESWPLPLSRSHYEYLALTHQARLAPGLVPDVLHHNEGLALVVMELIEPHIIMRKGLIAGTLYPRFVGDIATFLARTLFFSSDLALPAAKKKEGIAAFAGNHALCKITEDLIFTDPYRVAEQNRWTQPWLDATAAAFREDLDLHVAVSRLKLKFMNAPEALIHGDLHTGSIMVTESSTRRDRSRIRVLRTDGVRSRRGHRQSPDGLSGLRRPRTLAGRTAAVRGLGAGNDRKRLDGVRPRVPRALAHGSSRRRLSPDAVSRRCRCGASGGRAAGLYGAAVRRHRGIFGRKNHPPHSGAGAQCRFRTDRGSKAAGHLRGAEPAAGACHDGGNGVVPHASAP